MNVFRSNLFLRRRAERLATFVTLLKKGKGAVAVVALGAAMAVFLPAQTLTTYSFAAGVGEVSAAPLIQATNGNLWGTTRGMLYEVTPAGTFTKITIAVGYSNGALLQASNGDFYGTTGDYPGSVYKVTPAGIVTVLHTFCSASNCTDGAAPYGALIQAANGNLYGTTSQGGANGVGAVFKITLSGTLTPLWIVFALAIHVPDGSTPKCGLVQLPNGNLYGTTSEVAPTTRGRCSKSPRLAR